MATLKQVIEDDVAKLEVELETIKSEASAAIASKQNEIQTAKDKFEHFGAWLEHEAEAAGAAIKAFFTSHGITL